LAIFFLFMLGAYLLLAASAQASGPVPVTLEGCVIKGVFFSLEKEATPAGAGSRVYRMEVRKPEPHSGQKLDLSRYEGKKIRVQGRLLPGDVLIPGPQVLKVLGECDQESWKAIAAGSE
jgi:hypothetical protein